VKTRKKITLGHDSTRSISGKPPFNALPTGEKLFKKAACCGSRFFLRGFGHIAKDLQLPTKSIRGLQPARIPLQSVARSRLLLGVQIDPQRLVFKRGEERGGRGTPRANHLGPVPDSAQNPRKNRQQSVPSDETHRETYRCAPLHLLSGKIWQLQKDKPVRPARQSP